MKVVDLSQTISVNMSVFPGAKAPTIKQVANIADDYYVEHKIEITTHIGTHIDSPAHIVDGGAILIEKPVEDYIGSGYVLDVSKLNEIKVSDLQTITNIASIEFLLFKTNLGDKFDSKEYYNDFPVLTDEARKYLIENGNSLKGIGVDCFSVDKIEPLSIRNHIEVLGSGMIIIENLTNLGQLIGQAFILSVLPLKAEKIEGCPVRAVALILED